MNMGFVTDMKKVMNGNLKAFGTANGIEVALNNINAPTDTSIPYLSGFMLPAPVDQADLGVNELREAIYQIDINYASHLGDTPIDEMYDLLNETFKVGAEFPFGTICVSVDAVSPGPTPIANGWATMSMSIDIHDYTARL